MIISVVNATDRGDARDEDVQNVLRAINRQIAEDFAPYWHRSGSLRLEGKASGPPSVENPLELRGDAILYLWTSTDEVDKALGYHWLNHRGVPYGFVFLDICDDLGEHWSVTLSHEALELLMDPEANLLVQGPHPADPTREVFHWYEVCDAVQAQTYEIDDVEVSNFLLPLYFTQDNEDGARNDFLGSPRGPQDALKSFGVADGGYVGFFDPLLGDHDQHFADRRAHARLETKMRAQGTRRALRYQHPGDGEPTIAPPTTIAAATGEPEVTFEGFSVVVSCPASQKPATRLAKVVAKRLGKGWTIDETITESKRGKKRTAEIEVNPPARRTVTCAEAWDLKYELEADSAVVSAEPMFELCVHDREAVEEAAEDSPALRASFGGTARHLPEAEADRVWSLRMIRAFQAWEAVRDAGGTLGGEVRIAHPDTGYTEHPEIRLDVDRNPRPLDPASFDFVDGDATPLDPLSKEGWTHPSHGTSTSSVILSAKGHQGGMHDHAVTGVAPEASLASMRVTKRVVLFSMKRLRKAVDRAVGEGCDVVSISLGGPWAGGPIRRAIERAVKKGVIVCAAAGNYVKFVTFPARHEKVIAVAACNARRKPWKHSSRGKKVDVTAPGESVWRARSKKPDGSSDVFYDVAMSSGTSYAVANVAGVAALWIARHGKDALKKKYGRTEKLVKAFRSVLVGTCQPEPSLDPDRYGAGIVDALAVMNAPLPTAGRLSARRAARRASTLSPELEHFTELFEDLGQAAVEDALSALLDIPVAELGEHLGEIGEELSFHLARDPVLRARVETLAGGGPGAAPGRGRRAAGLSDSSDAASVTRRMVGTAGASMRLREVLAP